MIVGDKQVSPNAGGGYDVLPERAWFETQAQAIHYARTGVSVSEQEAIMAAQPNAFDEFLALLAPAQENARTLIRQFRELADYLEANPQILAATQATADGQVVEGAMLYKEQILTAAILIASVQSYADSALIPAGEGRPEIKVRHAIYRKA
jgi:hypothetical protein